jgi:ParB family chromosome partitioning protein
VKSMEIEVEKIRPNLRLIYEYDAIEAVCRGIQKGGEIEPLLVWFDGENFRIWDGEKRWRACKKLGIKRVKVFLVEFS